MQAQITGTTFLGTGAASLNGPLSIRFISPISMDRLQITTCAREQIIDNAGSQYVYNYVPTPDEVKGPCPLYAEAISKGSLTTWFFLGLKSTEDLASHVWCNGEGWRYSGMSVCQSKAGLIQSISFDQPITAFKAEDSCHLTTSDNQTFHVEPDLGFCRITFASKTGVVTHWHRAIFIGYKGSLVR